MGLKLDSKTFLRYCGFLFFYSLLVIVWGAWVRISHSGDGCGNSWPLCQGVVIPSAPAQKTLVELFHRATSGAFGIFVFALFLFARKIFPPRSWPRRVASIALLFTVSEALLGAKLVLSNLVADNDTPMRAFVISLHLVNSLILTASLALCWDSADYKSWSRRKISPSQIFKLSQFKTLVPFALVVLLIAVTGAVASLSNTLYPAISLLQGLLEDLSSGAHDLIRLRASHPIFGLVLGSSLIYSFYLIYQRTPESETEFKYRTKVLMTLVGAQIVAGLCTLLFLSPLPLKLTHLFFAHCLWCMLILWGRSFLYHKRK